MSLAIETFGMIAGDAHHDRVRSAGPQDLSDQVRQGCLVSDVLDLQHGHRLLVDLRDPDPLDSHYRGQRRDPGVIGDHHRAENQVPQIDSDSGEGRPETLSRDALFALRVEENQLGQIEH